MSTTPPKRVKPSETTNVVTLEDRKPEKDPTRGELALARVRKGDEVLSKPRTTWLIKNYLPARGWGVAYGAPGGGKSFHTLSLSLELAQGGRWAGQDVDPMKVLYVIAERPSVIADRQEAWALHYGKSIPENFHELVWAPQLHNGEDVDALCEVVRTLEIKFVCIDTLAQCTLGLEENSTQGMGLVIDALNRIMAATNGGSVHVVHHTGKDPTKGMRGSSALLGAADYTYEVGGDSTAIRVTVPKLNASTDPMPEWYRLEGVNMPALPGDDEMRSGAVLVPTTGKDAGTSRVLELVALVAESYTETGVTRKDVEEILEVRRTTAGQIVAAAGKLGWLTATGKGAQTRYYVTDDGLAAINT